MKEVIHIEFNMDDDVEVQPKMLMMETQKGKFE